MADQGLLVQPPDAAGIPVLAGDQHPAAAGDGVDEIPADIAQQQERRDPGQFHGANRSSRFETCASARRRERVGVRVALNA